MENEVFIAWFIFAPSVRKNRTLTAMSDLLDMMI
jgi:hypothetical protein